MNPPFDIAVIGGGSAGLSMAAAAAQFGQRVVLFEKAEMGGDCLNTGCVPSKALLAAAKAAQAHRASARFGIAAHEPQVDFAKVMAHVAHVIATIAPLDSQSRFEGLGVTVVRAHARFSGPRSLVADGKTYSARRIVIATGSRAALPPIKGLSDVPHFTNETLFANRVLPEHLVIIGAGPIGLEMAQAHRRLSARVTVLDAGQPLAKDDPELVATLLQSLKAEGIAIHAGVKIEEVSRAPEGGIAVSVAGLGTLQASHILVAAGRKPNIENLGLEAAGIAATPKGITVDQRLRTSNRFVFAAGDCAGGPQFTHVANQHAGLILRQVLFRLPVRNRVDNIPWVTFTEPELAHCGLTETEARKAHGDTIKVLRWPFRENDRAVAEGQPEGLVKLVLSPRGRLLGASILGPHAGEQISLWSLAISRGLKPSAIAGLVLPYPTLAEAGKRAAITHYAGLAAKPWLRAIIRWLKIFG